ncbi:MAG: hypothetical protein Q9187_002792 [Circinaria calcarea]
MHDSGNKEVLERAKESRATNNKGIMGWLVTQHEDWLQGAAEDGIRDLKLDEEDEVDEKNSKHGAEDIPQLLENFREAHPGIEVLRDEESQQLEVPSTARSRGGNHTELNRFNSLVPRAYELLASYSDILTRACENCDRLLDNDAQFPVVRTRKKTKSSDGTHSIRWLATHPTCM